MAFAAGDNPIEWVGTAGNTVPCPSKFQYKLSDVSDSESGRTEDGVMHKNRIGQVVGIELAWNAATVAEAATILSAFNPEYIDISYLDAMLGDYQTKTFYVGDRSVPLYNSAFARWENISFSVIMRGGEELSGVEVPSGAGHASGRETITGNSLTLADGKEYEGTGISELTLTYPVGIFECWLKLTFASSGTIGVTFPSGTTYIGGVPTFANGETWEMSIKDGVVIAGKVVAGGV